MSCLVVQLFMILQPLVSCVWVNGSMHTCGYGCRQNEVVEMFSSSSFVLLSFPFPIHFLFLFSSR